MATIPATTHEGGRAGDRLHRPRRHLARDERRGGEADRPPRLRRPATSCCPTTPTAVLRAADSPYLGERLGDDIVTASGTTLLGADNKTGVAEIMAAAEYLLAHPEIPHGTDPHRRSRPTRRWAAAPSTSTSPRFGARYAYTMDGGPRGELEYESFSADAMTRHLPRLQHPPRLRQGPDGQRDQGRRRLHRPPARRSACRPRPPTATRGSCTPTCCRPASTGPPSSCIVATSTPPGCRRRKRCCAASGRGHRRGLAGRRRSRCRSRSSTATCAR